MKAAPAAFAVTLLAAASSLAAGEGALKLSGPLDAPRLSEPLATARFFDTDCFLSNAGMRFSASREVTLEPEVGVGYHARDLELSGGMEQSTHRLHAQAGWRLFLAEALHFSAAAKLPVVTFESVGLYSGDELGTRPGTRFRPGYQINSITSNAISWRGEMGLHLGPRADFTLYYDQTPVSGWYGGGLHQEERIGTRFIIRFK